jgi:hypothetical protein
MAWRREPSPESLLVVTTKGGALAVLEELDVGSAASCEVAPTSAQEAAIGMTASRIERDRRVDISRNHAARP